MEQYGQMTVEERILAKNIKILINDIENIENFSYAINNKADMQEILRFMEQSSENEMNTRKFLNNNYDWAPSLIIQNLRMRCQRPDFNCSDFIS